MDDQDFQERYIKAIRSNNISDELQSLITPVGKLNQESVTTVYHKDYVARLTEALGETFETLWAVIGDEDFFKLVREYIRIYPSDCIELSQYGHKMPNFLSNHDLSSDYPFLADLAFFELSYWNTFHKPKEYSKLILEELNTETLLTSVFKLPTNIIFFSWDTPLYSLWKLREIGLFDFDGDIDENQFVILFKTDLIVNVIQLKENQFHILKAIDSGSTLEQAIEVNNINETEINQLFQIINDNNLLINLEVKT